jgi:hypothetical protein
MMIVNKNNQTQSVNLKGASRWMACLGHCAIETTTTMMLKWFFYKEEKLKIAKVYDKKNEKT